MKAKTEVAALNEIEHQAELLSRLMDHLAKLPAGQIDQRWFAIARTDLQHGFMALRRAVTKDAGF